MSQKNMNTLSFLKNLGLSEVEVALYEILLKSGQTAVGDIIVKSGLKRPTVYKTLYSLEKKGFVVSKDIKKKIHFSPEPPSKLMDQTERQFDSLRHARENLRSLLPELTASYIQSVVRPVVKEYEGTEGLKEVFKDIYGPKKEPVLGCVDLERSDEAIPEYITQKLIPLRIKNKVYAHTFLASSKQAEEVKKRDNKSMRKSVLLEKSKYPIPAEIDVYDDKVAMMSFKNGEFVGLLIQNKDFATSLKSIFTLAFERFAQNQSKLQSSEQ